ncbi:MAG: alpha-galactosidase [Fibrobacteres bacterium]|nr:alpha-galactosidase [Fibrobacterota bacterium]
MSKITFIGAGSLGFTRGLVRDILTYPLLNDSTITLMDIDPERLEFSRRSVQGLADRMGVKAKIEATLDRKVALKGADAVLCTILNGGVQVWRHDIEIPKKYGVDINIGDTRGPAGIFRALRTIPVMLDICRDMEKLCPNAILLNYTNPMAMLCRAMQQKSSIKVTGLCHSVQGTAKMLARWIGADYKDIDYTCAGINHQAFYLDYKWKGKDAYPLLRKAMANKKIYNEELVRNEMFIHLGLYVTESSGHNSEYNWWFRKRPDLIKKYCKTGTGWNPGHYAYILNRYLETEKNWKKETNEWFKKGMPMSLERGHEYAAAIINAYLGGDSFQFNGNVPNNGAITNLPNDICVEVPVQVRRNTLQTIHVGALPPQIAALNNITAAVEEMAVSGALTGDANMVFQACLFDPLTASVLSMAEIRKMVQEMLLKNKAYLPQFKSLKV